jgi:predicted Zn-dependent protease
MRHAWRLDSREYRVRLIRPMTAGVVFVLGMALPVLAAEEGLPQMGSSAEELLSPSQEAEYGAETLYQLRRLGYVLDDPLIEDWLDGMGHRLGAASGQAEQQFTFFMMRDREINAFATFGGYIGVNAGLVLTAESEDEVAGVLAHEISHVTQHHVLRAAEKARKDQIPLMLAEIVLIAAAQQAHDNTSNDAVAAAAIGAQALTAQRRINYTRASEAEADRIGIQTLYRSGYDVNGMAMFFDRMNKAFRGDSGGDKLPTYLQSHPVTAIRISEARDRAAQLLREAPPLHATPAPLNPLLPADLSSRSGGPEKPLRMFDWARERLRVLSTDNPASGLREYRAIMAGAGAKATDAQRYGMALAEMRAGSPAAAESGLQPLAREHPDNVWISLALADAAHLAHNDAVSQKRYEALLQAHPYDRPISLSYARMLNDVGDAEHARRAQAVLRPLLSASAEDPLFQQSFARACELAGDVPRAAEAYAESAYLNGRAEDALNQLKDLLKREDVDYVQRARVEARIAALTPVVLEMRRQGIKPQDQRQDDG